MKKTITYLSMLFYLVYCNGINFHLHYCGENIASVSMFVAWGGCMCEESSDEQEQGCCKDEIKSVKSGENHANAQVLSLQPFLIPAENKILSDLALYSPLRSPIFFKESRPPPKEAVPLYLLHRVFII